MKSQMIEGMMRCFIAERGIVMFICMFVGGFVNSLMLYPQSLTDAKITVKYKTEKDNATFFNGSKEVALTGEWTNGQSIRYILTLPVGAEKMSVNTTYDEDWNATDNEQTPKTPVL